MAHLSYIVGRTDFFPDQSKEVAGLLYDSIFHKLLPLGDHVILYPAHGSGSVCGGGMASREFSTLGYEKKLNPMLQTTDRESFIMYKINELHYKPPYFKQMEKLNLSPNVSPVGIVADDEQTQTAVRHLQRLGYDNMAGYLDEGLRGWESSGRNFDRLLFVL